MSFKIVCFQIKNYNTIRLLLLVLCFVFKSNSLSVRKDFVTHSWNISNNNEIWSSKNNLSNKQNSNNFQFVRDFFKNDDVIKKGKAFHLFPVPVDGECLSIDGRRTGTCFNVYECRLKGGIAQGDCSMGFGVCCIFLALCDQVIRNNITYLVSPNFPSPMPQNITSCKYKFEIMDNNVSQIRIDFNHFSIGQPNRKTGICDGDIFYVSGGTSRNFSLCGQNSGQHVYYDIGVDKTNRHGKKKIQNLLFKTNTTAINTTLYDEDSIEITMHFSKRFSPTRFWEIRIAQIPFSQRAPTNCLQYYNGPEGIIQTFNFAENGRHLANQNYKSCIRQEAKMCSIIYQPCDEHSFKIGPTRQITKEKNITLSSETIQENLFVQNTTSVHDEPNNTSSVIDFVAEDNSTNSSFLNDTEGSGEENLQFPVRNSAKPVRGGFDILSLFRSAFGFRNFRGASTNRQFLTTCNDRITMPCIIEDFVGVGMDSIPKCEPVHCGNQFCGSDIKPCRIESTVTPFYLGVHFGKGDRKGSAEDNIGACIRFTQMPCL